MSCTGRFATAADYDDLLGAGIDLESAAEVADVNNALDLAASDVHVALASAGACDCALADWAPAYLKKLNIIDAAVLHNAPCGGNRLSEEQRDRWREWLERQYELIRSGQVPLCAGDTGSAFPAFGTVEHSWTDWNQAEIIANEARRGLS